MQTGRKLSSIVLSLLFLLTTVPGAAADAPANQVYFITPQVSEGLYYDEGQLEDLFVEGRLEGDTFTFTKDKKLCFAVSPGEGWRFCEDFSTFFAHDKERAYMGLDPNDPDLVLCTYTAQKGRSVPFSDLEGIFLNATPEKLPRLEIDIEGSFDQINKQDWTAAHFKLTEGTKQYASDDYEGDGEIKGRGNTSWGFAQKPYSIKLGGKASLLDIPKTKKYAIVSPEADPSLLRNYITYKAGLELEGIGYTPKVELVEAWLNGQYNGVYALVERIDIESTKIDIPEADDANITGGYIIEKDAGDKVDWNNDPWFWCPYQANPNDDVFTVKAPDLPEDETAARTMLDYLTAYMQRLDGAIMGTSGEDYTKYVDIDSWVDFVIVQELSKNIDGNLKTSCYMYKEPDNDTLYMTALWDFDNAYGAAGWDNKAPGKNDVDDCPSGTDVEDFMVINSSCPWYKKLYDMPAFRQALKERYTQYRTGLIENILRRIDTGAAYLQAAAASQNDRWGRIGDYKSRVSDLKKWLEGRLNWLDSQWLLDTPETHEVTVEVEGKGAVARVDGEGPVEDRQTICYTVRPALGYALTRASFGSMGNDASILPWVKDGRITTPIVTGDRTLYIGFEKDPAAARGHIDVRVSEGGVLTDVPQETYAGDEISFHVTADYGYNLRELAITGKTSGTQIECKTELASDDPTLQYNITFQMPDEEVEIAADFERYLYTATAMPAENGSVAIEERWQVWVEQLEACVGEEVTVWLTPDDGYAEDILTGTFGNPLTIVGKSSGKEIEYWQDVPETPGEYHFSMPAEDVEIYGYFIEWPVVIVPGDMDKDGKVTIQDVMEACKVLARKSAGKGPTKVEMRRGNLDGDDAFTINDVMEICKILARKA